MAAYYLSGEPFEKFGTRWHKITIGAQVLDWLRDNCNSCSDYRFSALSNREVYIADKAFILLTLKFS